MMDNLTPEEEPLADSLSDGIFGVDSYEPESPGSKKFLPWHRPRKQFVRQKQWLEQIAALAKENVFQNNELRYLGLPGEDLLDLRFFHHKFCVPNNLTLKYVGFNYGANATALHSSELNVSIDEVSKLSNVDPNSIILGDDICQIANKDSVAHERSIKFGPYDIINIDLCDGFAKAPYDQFQTTHYNTLNQLLALQARRNQPWLLLITTRTGLSHINDEVFVKLKKLFADNLVSCTDFKNASHAKFGIEDNVSLEEKCKSNGLAASIFNVTLCKWIAGILVNQTPPAKMEVKSVIGYKVENNIDFQDLVSIAIKITPTVIAGSDGVGLATIAQTKPNECAIAVQALNRVEKLVDADALLSSNREMQAEMIKETIDLLEEARYDVSTYEEWAKNCLVL